MKKSTATWCIGLIAAVTVAMTFIQPTVIHQLVVWVSGLFAVVVALALFVVGNWPQPQNNASRALECAVAYLRSCELDDADIALALSVTLAQVKGIAR